jgi:hypothetical protein
VFFSGKVLKVSCLRSVSVKQEHVLHDGFGADTRMIHLREEAPSPFLFLIIQKEYIHVGLGTPHWRRETVCLQGTFPGFVARFEAGNPCSGKTLVVENAPPPACWSRTGLLSEVPGVLFGGP